MNNWLIKIAQLDLINISYLFKIGMSPSRVEGEIIYSLDPIRNNHWDISAGTPAILLDTGKQYIVALHMGILGFAPFKTAPNLWERTGKRFVGTPSDLEQLSYQYTGRINLDELTDVIDLLEDNPDVKTIFTSSTEIRAIFYDEPQGSRGYESSYQILLRNEPPELITITIIIQGQTKSIQADRAHLVSALNIALKYLEKNK